MEKFNFAPTPENENDYFKRGEGVEKLVTEMKEDSARREKYAEQLKKISPEEGIEVLQNLDINEKNIEFALRMAEIEEEQKSRSYLKTEVTSDTGEVIRLSGPSKFEGVKKEFYDEAKRTLTNPSKYVKAAVIAGLMASGLAYDFKNTALVAELAGTISDQITNGDHEAWFKTFDTTMLAEGVAIVGLLALSIKNGVKSISQTIKSKLVANQKMQRYVSMLAAGGDEETSKSVVDSEANKNGGYERSADQAVTRTTGYDRWTERTEEAKEQIKTVREKLGEMGIERIDRLKYTDKKKDLFLPKNE